MAKSTKTDKNGFLVLLNFKNQKNYSLTALNFEFSTWHSKYFEKLAAAPYFSKILSTTKKILKK